MILMFLAFIILGGAIALIILGTRDFINAWRRIHRGTKGMC